MKKALVVFLLIVAAGAAVVAVRQTSAARRDAAPRDLDIVRVTRRAIGASVKATGIIKPMVGAQVNVGSSVSGVVSRLLVRIGDRVEKGQLLAELDCRELVARRDAAEAALRSAEANLAYNEANWKRRQQLFEEGLIARAEFDLAEQARAVAEQQRNQARANLEDAATQLGYARIFAPITGVVSAVSTQEGETVAASFAAPTFVTLLDLNRLEVWAYVDETDIGRIRLGQRARFTVDTYGDREFPGRVTAIYPKPEIRDNVVDYVTVVRFAAPPGCTLRPEMTTTVNIDLERRDSALVLPTRAVRRDGNGRFVLVRRGDAIERRSISIGMKDENYWEISGGLQEGDAAVVGDPKLGKEKQK